ncbi:hypothetical protein LMG919_17770 [Xanthomonas vesicatoria]|nr:hypothetical protein LMG919_17770 [Xanthomonas vesicatoria]
MDRMSQAVQTMACMLRACRLFYIGKRFSGYSQFSQFVSASLSQRVIRHVGVEPSLLLGEQCHDLLD